MEKKRLEWLDACKGFAMIAVVLAHVVNGLLDSGGDSGNEWMVGISNICNSFMMPLFFCLSGVSFAVAYLEMGDFGIRVRNTKVKIQIINLIFIYVEWCILKCVIKQFFPDAVLVNNSLSEILMIPFQSISLYWYLYVMIICYFLAVIFFKKKTSIKIVALIATGLGLAQYWITYGSLESWTITKISMYFLPFWLGVLYVISAGYKVVLTRRSVIAAALTIGVMGNIIAFFAYYMNINDGRFIWADIPLVGVMMAVCLVVAIMGVFQKKNIKCMILQLIGRHSLEIYLMHTFLIVACRKFIPQLISSDFIHVLFSTLIGLFVPIMCSVVIKRMRLNELMFKPAIYFIKAETRP